MAKVKSDTLHVKGIDVGIYTEDYRNEYISLTDIARFRNSDDPRFAIQNWMRNRNTIEFLGLWESLHNPNFNRVQFDTFRTEAGLNRFVMTPSKWVENTGAIGITAKAGRYGGTYAHSDIAMEFASWISAEFKLYLMKDYRRLKFDENSRLSLSWNLNREISKLNYRVHTDAIQQNLLPPDLTREQQSFVYADEADMLNVALFGLTAAQWRSQNQGCKGNIRDYASLQQLLVLANMESYNALLIEQKLPQTERLQMLRQMAVRQLQVLSSLDVTNLPSLPPGIGND
ncbi:MAG: KilA-N domain-containing protein [Paraprevotella sp.]|nr:KilA-N domain-containing protein [Paraprevotella sp.]MDD6125337.1 KilA-N domain-containing protein [Paraprevotella sp.]